MDNIGTKEKLLERFYSGEITEEENGLLKELIGNGTETAEKDIDGILFSGLAGAASGTEVPSGLAEKIEKDIDTHFKARKKRQTGFVITMLSAAAAAIVTGMFFLVKYEEPKPADMEYVAYVPKDTFDDPAAAYAETVKALALMAENLGKGMDKAHRILSDTEQSANKALAKFIEYK